MALGISTNNLLGGRMTKSYIAGFVLQKIFLKITFTGHESFPARYFSDSILSH